MIPLRQQTAAELTELSITITEKLENLNRLQILNRQARTPQTEISRINHIIIINTVNLLHITEEQQRRQYNKQEVIDYEENYSASYDKSQVEFNSGESDILQPIDGEYVSTDRQSNHREQKSSLATANC